LQKELENYVTNNVFSFGVLDKKRKAQQKQNSKSNIQILARAGK